MKSFDEWYEENSWDVENYYDAEKSFKAGRQSKQAEVDELQLKLSEDSRVLHNVIDIERKKCEELQKRIDEALKFANDAHSDLNIGMLKMVDILKGDQS